MFTWRVSAAGRLLRIRPTLSSEPGPVPSRLILRSRSTLCSELSVGPVPSRLVLGIETSCDETGAAVVNEQGEVLGESLTSQTEVHLRSGGIIPTVAQDLHKQNLRRVVQEALQRSGVDPAQLSAVATTVKPGLALSLGVGLDFSRRFVRLHNKPFIPIHHMEAHALTARMLQPVDFPFLVLLVSGGHSLLALARGVDDFLLLGHSLDEAPGDTLDKVARRLSLVQHPRCAGLSGGQAIELLARDGDKDRFRLRTPMGQTQDCCFSFSGLRNQVQMIIAKQEAQEGVETGSLLSCVSDLAAATQHAVAAHLAKRTHRAIVFCRSKHLLPSLNPTLVLSGGVGRNQYIREVLTIVTQANGLNLTCPPAELCSDNGVMIAWNGVERLREGKGILPPDTDVRYEPRSPLGVDITSEVRAADIRVPSIKLKILR